MSETSTRNHDSRSEYLDEDRFYRALANHRRRTALRVLEENASMTVDALAAAVAEREVDERDLGEIEITLVHQHLPLMADAGMVDYDANRRQVTLRQPVREFLPLSGPHLR